MKVKRSALALVLAGVVLTVVGCGGGNNTKASDITISDFESQAIKEIDNGASVTITEEDGGKAFSAKSSSSSSTEWELCGHADKNEKIQNVSLKTYATSVEYFQQLTGGEILSLASEGMGHLRMSEIYAVSSLSNMSYIVQCFSKEPDSDAWVLGMQMLLDARNGEKTENGWKYSIETEDNEDWQKASITYKAEYVGE